MDGTPSTFPTAARRCAGTLLAALALLCATTPPAPAVVVAAPTATSDPSLTWAADGAAVHAALEVAHAHWAGVPCRGDVTPRWADLALMWNAQARWSNLEGQWSRPELNADCEIVLNR